MLVCMLLKECNVVGMQESSWLLATGFCRGLSRQRVRKVVSWMLLHCHGRYERRGWVTYNHSTDIKEACSILSTFKVKDTQLTCSVNRDLTRRVKQAPAASWTRKAVRSDLQFALNLVR